MEKQKYPDGPRELWRAVGELARLAVHHISGPHQLATHGNHDFKNNHLPVADSEPVEPGVDHWDAHGYPVYTDDQDLYLGQDPPQNIPYRHPFDAKETQDTRDL